MSASDEVRRLRFSIEWIDPDLNVPPCLICWGEVGRGLVGWARLPAVSPDLRRRLDQGTEAGGPVCDRCLTMHHGHLGILLQLALELRQLASGEESNPEWALELGKAWATAIAKSWPSRPSSFVEVAGRVDLSRKLEQVRSVTGEPSRPERDAPKRPKTKPDPGVN